jgi:hypothetical protein
MPAVTEIARFPRIPRDSSTGVLVGVRFSRISAGDDDHGGKNARNTRVS